MKTLDQLQNQFLHHTYYKGIPTCKNPMDLWVYQEIIHEVKPDIIIEIGFWKGGTTQFLADLIPDGYVYGIDIDTDKCHSSVKRGHNIKIVNTLYETIPIIDSNQKSLIIEDSSHTYENTLECLRNYSPLVSVGSYYIVEDTICKDLGYMSLRPDLAVEHFLKENNSFIADKSREKYITWNPNGFLKRVK